MHRESLTRFVLHHRGPKNPVESHRAYSVLFEEEMDPAGALAPTAVVFLTNRECPFRCVMCDLWVNTLDQTVPPGAIPAQIRQALAQLPPARQVKLYNAGSFFDPGAIPPADDEAIAHAVEGFDRVIVEAHPAFLAGAHGERCLRLRDRLSGQLEVAVGLETAHPDVLARLNKAMTVDSFRRAAAFLEQHRIAMRVFVLLSPPFMPASEALEWTRRSIDVAVECGATACTIIPTRGGNGAMEALGQTERPRLRDLEDAIEYALGDSRRASPVPLRVFADLWNLERLAECGCSERRIARLEAMNREQRVQARVVCGCDDRH